MANRTPEYFSSRIADVVARLGAPSGMHTEAMKDVDPLTRSVGLSEADAAIAWLLAALTVDREARILAAGATAEFCAEPTLSAIAALSDRLGHPSRMFKE